MVPVKCRPYLHLARADKQIGTLLLLWPCYWGISLAKTPDVALVGKFTLGAIIMRSAGCIINDIWDKEFDKHVERTMSRPLASGDLNVKQAVAFLGVNLTLGLAILLSLNHNAILVGICSMPLVVVYPLMKRFTNWPQLVLGLTFNWGVPLGWTAAVGSLDPSSILPLYSAGVCWTLVYDTLYGYQDRKDDAKLGLKSTSLYLGNNPQIPLTLVSSGFLGGLIGTGLQHDLSSIYYVGTAAASAHLLWQIWTANIDSRSNLWQRFQSNQYTGAIVTASIIAGQL